MAGLFSVLKKGQPVEEAPATLQAHPIRVYFEDASYQSILITPNLCLAKDVCDHIVQKLNTSEAKDKAELLSRYRYALFEVKSQKVTQLSDDANILNIITKWPKKKHNYKLLFKSPTGDPLPRQAIQEALKAIESPIQYVIHTIQDLLKEEVLKGTHVESELRQILTLATTTNLYDVNFNKLETIENELLDNVTKSWLMEEIGGQRWNKTTNSEEKKGNTETIGEAGVAEIGEAEGASKLADGEQEMYAELKAWGFNVFDYQPSQLLPRLMAMLEYFNLINIYKIPVDKLKNFLVALKDTYHPNPYHNFLHAFDVTQTVFSLLTTFGGSKYLNSLDIFGLLLSAMIHDLDHPGVNNGYQVNAFTELALNYNDQSVLENHHVSTAFKILMKDEFNILKNLSVEDWREFRRICILNVMMTDMAHHFVFANKFKQRLNSGQPFSRDNKDDRDLVCTMILKCADISNIAKPWELSKPWADRVTQENFSQGDKEKELDLPVAAFMDRTKSEQSRNTSNFIDFVAGPIFETLEQLLPEVSLCNDLVKINRKHWDDIMNKNKANPPSASTHPPSSTPAPESSETPASSSPPPPPPPPVVLIHSESVSNEKDKERDVDSGGSSPTSQSGSTTSSASSIPSSLSTSFSFKGDTIGMSSKKNSKNKPS